MASASTYVKATSIGLVMAYAVGLVVCVVVLALFWALGKWPAWPWWEFALAPLWVGLIALAGSWLLGPYVARARRWNASISQWKKAAFLVGLFGLIAAYAFLGT